MDEITVITKSSQLIPISPLLNQLWPEEKKDYSIYLEKLFENDYHLIFIEKNKEVIAFACMHIDDSLWSEKRFLELHVLVVDEKYRGQGVGSTILTYIENFAQQNGCDFIQLMSAIHREKAHGFYKEKGYIIEDVCFFKNIK